MKNVEKQTQVYLQSIKKGKPGANAESQQSSELYAEIKHSHDQCKSLTDEKIDIIDQMEKMIDRHLLQLDKHIGRFRDELKEMKVDQKPVYEETGIESLVARLPKKRYRKPVDGLHMVKIAPNMKLSMGDASGNEQQVLYCKCQKLLYEEMIECDNPKCKYKWFHFSCVGLTAAPREDEWYCPDCSLKLANKHKCNDSFRPFSILSVLPLHANCLLSSQGLSLIHICRCRRYAVCRSRWSPYH
eukprot:TRINITY_DN1904_c0_g1_i6.p2 TRINITY_DN1904_c0_g1~~TRINITY_DN1904_c0_g1_i6.p2  ORF type:complete len:243 (+),score=49.78 TRINITY_DN1904_c0_g1_i6:319-1047(+)